MSSRASNPPENQRWRMFRTNDATPATPIPVMRISSFTGSGLNDMTLNATYTQISYSHIVITVASTGTPDTFDWTQTGGSAGSGSGVSMSTSFITLADGVQIKWAANHGHTASNSWVIDIWPRNVMYFDTDGAGWALWSNGDQTSMGDGGSFDPHSPGPIGDVTPGTIGATGLSINGDSDAPQLKVKGIADQSTNIAEVSNSDGNQLWGVTSDGAMQLNRFGGTNTAVIQAGNNATAAELVATNGWTDNVGVTKYTFGYSGVDNTAIMSGTRLAHLSLTHQITDESIATLAVPEPTAIMELDSVGKNRGFLPPKLTTTQRNAISSPAEGLMIYNVTTHKLNVFTGSTWEQVTSL